jgi:hypothetical protein
MALSFMKPVPTISVVALAAFAGWAQLSAQPATDRPAFEVASVKINKSGDRRGSMDLQAPDRLTMTNQGLNTLISFAYRVPPGKLLGGPSWIASERFDIAAKTDKPTPLEQKMDMLRTLLEDRFALKVRKDVKDGLVYHLVLARSDGRLGPDMRPDRSPGAVSRRRHRDDDLGPDARRDDAADGRRSNRSHRPVRFGAPRKPGRICALGAARRPGCGAVGGAATDHLHGRAGAARPQARAGTRPDRVVRDRERESADAGLEGGSTRPATTINAEAAE